MLKFGANKRSRDGGKRREYNRLVDINQVAARELYDDDDKSIRGLLDGLNSHPQGSYKTPVMHGSHAQVVGKASKQTQSKYTDQLSTRLL